MPKLYFSPSHGDYGIGSIINAHIFIDTAGQPIDAVDLSLRYNKRVLMIEDSNENLEGIQMQNRNLLSNTQINKVDTRRGIISFSQTTNESSNFSGSGVLATVRFRVIDKRRGHLNFVYRKNNSRDTNLVRDGEDILEEVSNAKYNVNIDNLPLTIFDRFPSGAVFAGRYQNIKVKTNKSARCRYSKTPNISYSNMRRYFR